MLFELRLKRNRKLSHFIQHRVKATLKFCLYSSNRFFRTNTKLLYVNNSLTVYVVMGVH